MYNNYTMYCHTIKELFLLCAWFFFRISIHICSVGQAVFQQATNCRPHDFLPHRMDRGILSTMRRPRQVCTQIWLDVLREYFLAKRWCVCWSLWWGEICACGATDACGACGERRAHLYNAHTCWLRNDYCEVLDYLWLLDDDEALHSFLCCVRVLSLRACVMARMWFNCVIHCVCYFDTDVCHLDDSFSRLAGYESSPDVTSICQRPGGIRSHSRYSFLDCFFVCQRRFKQYIAKRKVRQGAVISSWIMSCWLWLKYSNFRSRSSVVCECTSNTTNPERCECGRVHWKQRRNVTIGSSCWDICIKDIWIGANIGGFLVIRMHSCLVAIFLLFEA